MNSAGSPSWVIGVTQLKRFWRRSLLLSQRLLTKHIVLALTILFCVGASLTLLSVWQLSEHLIQMQAQENAAVAVQNLKTARTLYSDTVVSRLRNFEKISITHDYTQMSGGIPLPATYLIELGEQISGSEQGTKIRLYSDYPFPWRMDTGGARDKFEREALEYLRTYPEETFSRVEKVANRLSLRYAAADRMQPSCVSCHNTHPDTPKRDWQVGDVRGVVEVIQPLDQFVQRTRLSLTGLLGLLLAICTLGLAGLSLAIRRLNNTSKILELKVQERTADLQHINAKLLQEQAKSNKLLLNILPPRIADQLRNDGTEHIADGFGEVTILFADIVGFTSLSESYSPQALVSLLNEIFSTFDSLSERFQLEKIKTIGDAYMVASGLPEPRPDHAQAIAEMALAMKQELGKLNERQNLQIAVRIGINSGPVVAGVIGTKKFIYDLWGDAVNTASRMESHGIPNEIQVSESTYLLLQDEYEFTARDAIEIKGKGLMQTYLLVGRKGA